MKHREAFKNLISNTKYKNLENDIMELYDLAEKLR